jgi:hypothetical protein
VRRHGSNPLRAVAVVVVAYGALLAVAALAAYVMG